MSPINKYQQACVALAATGYKRCFVCKEVFPLAEMERDKRKAGGRGSRCATCKSELNRLERTTERYRQRRARYRVEYEERRPNVRGVQNMTKYAIKTGRLVPPKTCEGCGRHPHGIDGARGIQAHHEDYSKPFDVTWLCIHCHSSLHASRPRLRPQPAEKAPERK